jgi:two-component system cell cycle sensor histidine kinase/response regulator CckA
MLTEALCYSRRWPRVPPGAAGALTALLFTPTGVAAVVRPMPAQPHCSFAAGLGIPPLPGEVLLVSAALAILSVLAIFFEVSASLRAGEAEAANAKLQREIAEHKLTEQALAQVRDELERRVEERTAELARANADLRAEIENHERFAATLRASEERYRELFDSANDLVWVHDLDGKITAINKAAQHITGYTQEDALRLNLAQLVAPEDTELVREMAGRLLAGEPPKTYDVTVVTKAGRRLALELSTHLVFRDGAPVALQTIARDITERQRLEEQLRQSQKMEAVGRLAGGLAHDVNNLLTVVAAYAQMIADDPGAGPAAKAGAAEILAVAERGGALTTRLLVFSRRQVLQPQVLDLNRLVLGMDNMLRRLIGEDIELKIVLGERVGCIKADPNQIEQVVMNLVVNARDAMPRGGRLTLRTSAVEFQEATTPVAAAGARVALSVSDTGVGMTPEVRDRAFEPFFTTKEPGKGTGLGLSMVYGIVKQSGGEIVVESEEDKGATLTVYFPQAAQSRPEPGRPAREEALPAPSNRRETILLVEDEPGVRKLVRQMLIERGYRVLEAGGGAEALDLARAFTDVLDAALLDLVMPQMNGTELAAQLSAARPGLKILYMSGYSDEALLEHGIPAQEAALLKKPFLPDALDRSLRKLFEGSAAAGA